MSRVAIPLAITPPAASRGGAMVEFGGPTMGVAWNVKAVAPSGFDLAAAQAEVQKALNRLVAQMSPWEPQSDITRFNQAPAGAWMDLPRAFGHVMERALFWAQASDGAFDPTAGALVDLWGFGPPGPVSAPPNEVAIAQALLASGWDRLALEERRLFQPGGLRLDLSGVAKGFGVDEVGRVLFHLGLTDYLVEIGGELRGEGIKPDGQPWWVEVAAPPRSALPGGPLTIALHGLAIATSGDYRRVLKHAGRRYGHTLDPRLGRPIENGLRSVSVVHETCVDADALSTVLGVLGPVEGLAFAERHEVAAHFLVEDGGLKEILSSRLQAMLD